MQAIILAAGKGKRMGDLTKETPKPMLSIEERNLLEWKIDNLPPEINEIILVVGYLQHTIRDYFGNEHKGRKITYVEVEPLGTGYTLWQCKDVVKDKFLVLMGDDLYSKEAIKNACKYDLSLTVKYSDVPRGGAIDVDENMNFLGIDDKTKRVGYICTGLYSLDTSIFDTALVKVPGTEEWGLPHTLVEVSKKYPVKVLETDNWYQVTAPEDLNPSQEILKAFI